MLSVMDPESPNCPNCGAPLVVPMGETEVPCEYCSSLLRFVPGAEELEVVAPLRVSDLRADADGQWPSPFDFGGKPCLVIRTENGDIKAFSALCTHTDCTVKFRPDKNDIFCSCHAGIYDTNGQNVSGPPPRPLQAFKVVVRGKPGEEEITVSRG